MSPELPRVYLARHGETEWTVTGQHTGRSDIPLTARGEDDARRLGERLREIEFARVLTSPLRRAVRTCELAGHGARAEVVADLAEVDYGEYEGLRTVEIRRERPGWSVFRDGSRGGESPAQVAARADRVVARLRADGDGLTLVFSHAHFLRFLAARWLGLSAGDARGLVLATGSLSILGYEHTREEPALRLWNDTHHLEA